MAVRTGLRVLARPGYPDFLDLPWELPLDEWRGGRLIEVARGVHRHVVRFVHYEGTLFALKELPPRLAEREYRMLRRMAEEGLPVVEAVGVVNRSSLEDVLITRFLDYSLPYRTLFTHRRNIGTEVSDLYDRLLDALAMLLVRMHLAGFFWGDCSLSNTLFRRDAGALAAYIVDVETGEWHPRLSDGQRDADLEVTQLNVAGGLMDVQAQLELPPEPDPIHTAEDLRQRYDRLWEELTTEVTFVPDERYRIAARVRRLNELGFDVDELSYGAADGGDRLVLNTSVTEAGHHRRRLLSLTGLVAQENQARSLLNDLADFRAHVERLEGRPLPESVAAYRWLIEVFEPTVQAIPEAMHAKLEPAELFHEVILHKWYLSEAVGEDVGVSEAVQDYVDAVLPAAPDERIVMPETVENAEGWIGFG